jgi:hypothetical protein
VFEAERPFLCFSVLKVVKLTPPLSRHLIKLAPTFQRFHPLSDPPLHLWQLCPRRFVNIIWIRNYYSCGIAPTERNLPLNLSLIVFVFNLSYGPSFCSILVTLNDSIYTWIFSNYNWPFEQTLSNHIHSQSAIHLTRAIPRV